MGQYTYAVFSFLLFGAAIFLIAQYNPQARDNCQEEYDGNIIPRRIVFGDPAKTAVEISPDGSYVSYVAPRNGVKNIYIASAQMPEQATPVTNDQNRGIAKYVWAYDNKHILYVQDTDGDENWRIYKLNIQTMESTLLTPGENIQARFQKLSEKHEGGDNQ